MNDRSEVLAVIFSIRSEANQSSVDLSTRLGHHNSLPSFSLKISQGDLSFVIRLLDDLPLLLALVFLFLDCPIVECFEFCEVVSINPAMPEFYHVLFNSFRRRELGLAVQTRMVTDDFLDVLEKSGQIRTAVSEGWEVMKFQMLLRHIRAAE